MNSTGVIFGWAILKECAIVVVVCYRHCLRTEFMNCTHQNTVFDLRLGCYILKSQLYEIPKKKLKDFNPSFDGFKKYTQANASNCQINEIRCCQRN